MHQQLKKLGLFLRNSENDKPSEKLNDKVIKYLYQNQKPPLPKAGNYKREVRSANDAELYSKHVSRRRKPSGSQTQLFFIGAEEVKKHRSERRQLEKVSESKRKHQKNDGEVVKMHSEPHHKDVRKDDYQWLTKKEIFKILNKVKDNPAAVKSASDLLKRFFVLDPAKPSQTLSEKKKHRLSEDAQLPWELYKDKSKKKTENDHVEKKSKRRHSHDGEVIKTRNDYGTETRRKHRHSNVSAEVDHEHESRKKHRHREEIPEIKAEVVYDGKELKKRHRRSKELTEAEADRSKDNQLRKKHRHGEESSELDEPKSKHTSNPLIEERQTSIYEDVSSDSKKIKPRQERDIEICDDEPKKKTNTTKNDSILFKNVSRVNSSRHRRCLVKTTFAIVDIPSTKPPIDLLEAKKKLKYFKKYYRYQLDNDSASSVGYHTVSDSNKLYQDPSDKSMEEEKKRRNVGIYTFPRDLTLETHVSTIVINPTVTTMIQKVSENGKDSEDSRKTYNLGTKRSKIPVFNTNSRFQSPALTKEDTAKQAKTSSFKYSSRKKQGVNSSNAKQENGLQATLPTKRVIIRDDTASLLTQKQESTNRNNISNKISDVERRNVTSSPRSSNEYASSVFSKGSAKSCENSLASKSDTKLHATNAITDRKYKTFDGSVAITSASNSTFGDKSIDSSKYTTSLLLTKTYKDDDKMIRYQKRKQYADSVRRNLINRSPKTATVPSPVFQVRYLTITNDVKEKVVTKSLSFQDINAASKPNDVERKKEETPFSEDKKKDCVGDLPCPRLELVAADKFDDMFRSSIDDALDKILNENYDFLNKDFSYNVEPSNNDSSDEESSQESTAFDKWYNFQISENNSYSDISSCNKSSLKPLQFGSQDNIVGKTASNISRDSIDKCIVSCSAPASEESGYSTIKSSVVSTTFFDRPEIKSLLQPVQTSLSDLSLDVKDSTSKELEIHSIKSKSLQATVEYDQKSIQIKMSEEEIPELIVLKEPEIQEEIDSFETHHDQIIFSSVIVSTEEVGLAQDVIVTEINRNAAVGLVETKKRKRKKWRNWSFLSCITCTRVDQ